jgi:integrase
VTARHKLSAREVIKFAKDGEGSLGDGAGLWLIKRSPTSIAWMFRYSINSQRSQMGLGSLYDVSLAEAREAADKWRGIVKTGGDPIRESEKQKKLLTAQRTTLTMIALEAFEAKKAELRGDGKTGRWFATLDLHILSKLGSRDVESIDQNDIKHALDPIWHTKAATADKAIGRLGICMQHAAAKGLDVDLQIVAKARALLGKQRHKPQNHKHIIWQEMPKFYETLSETNLTKLAMRLLILTGSRSGPLRKIRPDEIDFGTAIWTIPAENMKGNEGKQEEFRVPLSNEAIAVIEAAMPFSRNGNLFPNVRQGVISDGTLSKHLRTQTTYDAVPHGFRTSLRTWLADETDASHEVAESCLSHITGSKVARAYQRSDLLELRRDYMQRWADYLTDSDAQ